MNKDKYKVINLQSVLDNIGNGWSSDEDLNIHTATKSNNHRLASVGRKLTEEAKAKLVLAHTGRKLTEEHKAKMSLANKGKKPSKENIEKLAAFNRGKKISDEIIAKRIATRNTKGSYKMSDETKEKLLLANIGKKQSPEHIAKRVTNVKAAILANGGYYKRTEEHKAKIRAANIGRKPSPETIAKREATRTANRIDKPVTYKDITYANMEEACKILNLTYTALYKRIYKEKKRKENG